MELSPEGQSPRVQPGSSPLSLWCPGCRAAHRAGGSVPPNLLVHVVVVGQASRLVQRILLHGGIGSGLGWGKERRWRGASRAPGLCPLGPGGRLAVPARTTSSALQETSPARFLAVQV